MPIHKADYQGYQAEEGELYHHRRRRIKDVHLDLFTNQVFEDAESKALDLYVTDFYEDESIAHIYAEMEGVEYEEYKKRHQAELEKIDPHHWEDEEEKRLENAAVLERYQNPFSIMEHRSIWISTEKEKKEANLNAFAGMVVRIPLGQGILNFCYADFKTAVENRSALFDVMAVESFDAIKKVMGRKDAETPPEVIHPIQSKSAEIIYQFERYSDTFTLLSDELYTSLYTGCFPPVFHTISLKNLQRYLNYLCLLQEDMRELIEFCFDESFYPTLLGELHPVERYGLYCTIKDITPSQQRAEVFSLSRTIGFGTEMPYGITAQAIKKRLQAQIDTGSEEYQAFMQRFSIMPSQLDMMLQFPSFLNIRYECCTIYEMLMLEFTKMLEHGIRFKKCKNCGKYFILKGNYKTDYCDRIPEGESKDCQTIASLKNYREKVAGSGAWLLYNKFYKRYHARMKAGNIDTDVFKKWQYAATAMRDDCEIGTVSEEDFETWLHGSFPNRKRK